MVRSISHRISSTPFPDVLVGFGASVKGVVAKVGSLKYGANDIRRSRLLLV